MIQIHTPLRAAAMATFFAMVLTPLSAQVDDCDGTRYRYTSAFESFEVDYDVEYGNAINSTGLSQSLLVDVYQPEGDANTMRPLIIMAHGGFFIGGENDNPDVLALCEDLTKMGFVVGSITYRLGIDNFLDVSNALVRSVWRGYHDGKAAVRYFRKTAAEDGNPWGIDPDRIYFAGVSAGGFIGLHLAYVDDESEVPPQVDQTAAGMGGGLEGESGSPGYSSAVSGVVNIAGALKTADYLSVGDEPLVSVHGNEDGTVPFGTGMISLGIIPITDVDGSSVIHAVADELGIENCFTVLEGADHVAHVGDADAYYQTLGTVSGALSSWLCESYEPQCGAYDYEAVGVAEWLQAQHGQWRAFPTVLEAGESLQIQWLSSPSSLWNYEVYDARGRFIETAAGTGEWFSVSTGSLASGLHFIRIQGTSESHRFWVY
ncbi:MAG: hypothetical protein CL828_00110 [Crocinitomicaceae bacterium]|nr:hypothetical protein [Crocinitomicaceae bacterium]